MKEEKFFTQREISLLIDLTERFRDIRVSDSDPEIAKKETGSARKEFAILLGKLYQLKD